MALGTHDVLLGIFSSLSLNDARRASVVCKSWLAATRDSLVVSAWKRRSDVWEQEEESSRLLPASEVEIEGFSPLLPTTTEPVIIEWAPTRLYNDITWGPDVTMLEIMGRIEKRHAVLAGGRRLKSSNALSSLR
jgi:hypothetical protein